MKWRLLYRVIVAVVILFAVASVGVVDLAVLGRVLLRNEAHHSHGLRVLGRRAARALTAQQVRHKLWHSKRNVKFLRGIP